MPYKNPQDQRDYYRKYRERNKEKEKERIHQWYLKNKQYVLEVNREYSRNNKDKRKEYFKSWYEATGKEYYKNLNKNKVKARGKVKYALAKNIIHKLPCKICKNPKSEAHHLNGYHPENWLNIKWLCAYHHAQIEKQHDI